MVVYPQYNCEGSLKIFSVVEKVTRSSEHVEATESRMSRSWRIEKPGPGTVNGRIHTESQPSLNEEIVEIALQDAGISSNLRDNC